MIELRIGILEDDKTFVSQYINMLERWASDTRQYSVKLFDNGQSLIDLLQSGASFDILFLDIQLPDDNGMVIAEKLRKSGYENLIVFISSFSDYLQKGYEVGAFRYYLKPLAYDDFLRCMEFAINKIAGNYLKMTIAGEHLQIPFKDITYISCLGHYSTIYTNKEEYSLKISLKELLEKLPAGFIRCHRSYVLNSIHVYKLSGNRIQLDNGAKIDVSKKFLPSIRQEIVKQFG